MSGTYVIIYSVIISSTTKPTAAGDASKMKGWKGGKGVCPASIQQNERKLGGGDQGTDVR